MRRVRVIAPELLREHEVHQAGAELLVPYAEALHLEAERKVEIMRVDFDASSTKEDLLSVADRFSVPGITTHSTKPEIVHALKLAQKRDERAEAKEAAEIPVEPTKPGA